MSNLFKQVCDAIYPVGSIYMSVHSTSPATLFGGTWVAITGRFLIGQGPSGKNSSTYWGVNGENEIKMPAGETGGVAWQTLTVDQLPSHNHGHTFYNDDFSNAGDGETDSNRKRQSPSLTYDAAFQQNAWNYPTLATGGGKPHPNMPPYLVVYMWKRTA